MHPYVALICFPVVFLAELPDKTMFASLVMATKGRPSQVWLGAAGAFVVHVGIATTVGVALFASCPTGPSRPSWPPCSPSVPPTPGAKRRRSEEVRAQQNVSQHGAALTALVVIFLAEWGDLTQVVTADLAAKYHSALSVGVGSLLALWTVAAAAVVGGQTLLRFVNIKTVRKVNAVVLFGLAAYTVYLAAR